MWSSGMPVRGEVGAFPAASWRSIQAARRPGQQGVLGAMRDGSSKRAATSRPASHPLAPTLALSPAGLLVWKTLPSDCPPAMAARSYVTPSAATTCGSGSSRADGRCKDAAGQFPDASRHACCRRRDARLQLPRSKAALCGKGQIGHARRKHATSRQALPVQFRSRGRARSTSTCQGSAEGRFRTGSVIAV